MVGRNDPCTCGSGKKYKKCCGKEEVVDLQQMINAELDGIQREFAEEGLEPKEFYEMKRRVAEWQSVLSSVFERDMVEALAFESFIFHDRVDIWQDYISRKKKTQKRQRVLDVLDLWEKPFYFLAEVVGVEDGVLELQEKVAGNSHHMLNIGEAKQGEWLFGIVMQSLQDGKQMLQPVEGIITIPDFKQPLVEELADRLKNGVSEPLELYRAFVESIPDLGLSAFQEKVMDLVSSFVEQYELKEEVIKGIAFTFLRDVPVNAKKPEGVAAGILQAASDFALFGDLHMTQKSLAKQMGTTAATLTKYADLVGDYVMEKVDRGNDRQQPPGMSAVVTEMGTDPRMTERNLWEMIQFTKNVQSEDEVNKILQQPNKKYKPVTDAEQAQLFCYEAFETNGKERERLARAAFKLNPKSGDANLLMAEIVEHAVDKRLHYLTALNTGYRNFDDSFETAWGYVPNRPFLRALFSYGAWLMEQGDYKEAIEQLTELMEKNPNDQQGAKWLLMSAYIRAGEWEEASYLTDGFPLEDNTGKGMYFHYLADLQRGILKSYEIKEMKQFVRKQNPYLFSLLKNAQKPGTFPRSLTLQAGSKDEAALLYWLIYGIEETKAFLE